jgi:hypothetical protein
MTYKKEEEDMNANSIVRGFIACVLSLCLSGWSLVSSVTAATIMVNTNLDVVDPPFNTGGLCGSGTVADLPGADGKVSLREAIIAANNTPGQKTITFASSLSGATIVLTGTLLLCGGHTTLNGDVNGDETPDITVDGAAVLAPFDVIGVVSSHNTVKNLRVLAPPPNVNVAGISITTTLVVATTVMDNTIAHNIVSGQIVVIAGIDAFSNGQSINAVTIKHTIVRDNSVSGPGAVIEANNYGDHNVITDLTIAHNIVSGAPGPGIIVFGGLFNFFDPNDDGATDDHLDVTIKDNTSTGNSNPGDVAGIEILGGFFSSSNNQVSAQILNNAITNNNGIGIAALSGVVNSSDNGVDVIIKDNTVTDNSNPGSTAGIAILGGGFSSSNNQVTTQLLDNTITNNNGNGISVVSGQDNSSHNDVVGTIRGNTLENNARFGIVTYGAIGALLSPSGDSSGNNLDARIERNTVKNAFLFGIRVSGGIGSVDGAPDKVANDSEVNAVVTDNTVTGTTGEGMHLDAGGSGEANDNDVEVTVRKNTVCGSTAADIHAIGGLLGNPFLIDNTGTGNALEGEISENTASTVVVEDGVAGNTADVTQSKNVRCP